MLIFVNFRHGYWKVCQVKWDNKNYWLESRCLLFIRAGPAVPAAIVAEVLTKNSLLQPPSNNAPRAKDKPDQLPCWGIEFLSVHEEDGPKITF